MSKLEQLSKPTPIFSVSSNTKRALYENLMAVLVAFFVIIIFFFFSYWQAGFVSFSLMGVIIQPLFVILIFFLCVTIISLLVLFFSYLFTGKIKYDFFKNKLIVYQKYFMRPEKIDEVSFQEIQRIQIKHQKDNPEAGKIILNIKDGLIVLDSLNHVEEVEFKLRNLLQEFMVIQPLKKSARVMKLLKKQAEKI